MPADRPPSDFVSQYKALEPLVACPACEGDLRLEDDHLVCMQCARVYPIVDGIPVLIVDRSAPNQGRADGSARKGA